MGVGGNGIAGSLSLNISLDFKISPPKHGTGKTTDHYLNTLGLYFFGATYLAFNNSLPIKLS